MQNKLLVWGASGHALVVADIIRLCGRYEIVGFIDDVGQDEHPGFGSAMVFRDRAALDQQFASGVRRLIMGFGDCAMRLRLAEFASGRGFEFVKAIHPHSSIGSDTSIGAGTVVAAGAVISSGARVGQHVIININAGVHHECLIEDGAHVAPGATIGSCVSLGRGALVGIGAVVKNRVRIGAGAIIGAGAVVVEDVPDNVVAYGVPAKVKQIISQEYPRLAG